MTPVTAALASTCTGELTVEPLAGAQILTLGGRWWVARFALGGNGERVMSTGDKCGSGEIARDEGMATPELAETLTV